MGVALERMAESQPELILLDLMMPEMDGFGSSRRCASLAVHPRRGGHGEGPHTEDRQRLNGYVEQTSRRGRIAARSCCMRFTTWWRPASSQDVQAQRRLRD